ncbi:MAG: hypothetical protein WC305_00375 [Bacteroidales bacterium]
MKKTIRHIRFVFRFAISMFAVSVFIAASCDDPVPPPIPIVPDPEISEEKKSFIAAEDIGLYIKGICVLNYDENTFQKSTNAIRKIFRIQMDNQEEYLHINYVSMSEYSDDVVCKITYRLEDGEITILVIKFLIVQQTSKNYWLWNELQKTGVIVPIP